MKTQKNPITAFFTSREGYLAIFVAILFVVLYFTTNLSGSMYIFLRDLAYLIAGGLALMMVIMLGEIDISSGTVLGLIGFVTGTTLKMGIPIPAVLLIAVCVGMLNSAIIAFVTVRFRVPSMIVSLAMVKLHVGVFPLLPDAGWVSNIPSSISDVGGARLFGVFPVILLFALVMLIFFCWFMKYTRFGRKVYAVGGNKESAKLAGINADKVTFLTFLTSGALLGVTAMMYWLPKTQVIPSGTIGMEMYFLPIAVVGGVSIMGGTGRPIGILVAGILIAMLQRACLLFGLGNQYVYLSYGLIVLIAVYATVSDIKIFKGKKTVGGAS